jgi:hypothetical protein
VEPKVEPKPTPLPTPQIVVAKPEKKKDEDSDSEDSIMSEIKSIRHSVTINKAYLAQQLSQPWI